MRSTSPTRQPLTYTAMVMLTPTKDSMRVSPARGMRISLRNMPERVVLLGIRAPKSVRQGSADHTGVTYPVKGPSSGAKRQLL